MDFKQLDDVNKMLLGIDVKGKEYVEVNQRVLAFRRLYPEGTIETEILSLDNGIVTIKAIIKIDDKILATGTAQEKEGSTFINKTSYIENCETSAVGRALGFLGIGINKSIASAEEVINAVNNQDDPVIKVTQEKAIREVIKNHNIETEKVTEMLKKLGHEKLNELKQSEYMNFYKELTNEK